MGIAGLVLGLGTAHAGERAGPDGGIVWKPRGVRYPVAPAAVLPAAPFVPGEVDEVAASIELGPDRAAVVWVDALDIVRVRRVDGAPELEPDGAAPLVAGNAETGRDREGDDSGAITLTRVVGAGARVPGMGRAALVEPASAVAPGIWYIAQPPARGDVWVISAPQPMTVVVEHPVRHESSALWESVRGDILRWIDEDGAVPRIPMIAGGSELALVLRADRAVGRLLEAARPGDARFVHAVRAWRKASALAHLDTVGERRQPYHLHRSLTRALAAGAPGEARGRARLTVLAREQADDVSRRNERPYARIDADRAEWSLELEGPGILEIDVRARIGDAGEPELRTLEVRAAGRTLERRRFHSQEARVRAPDSEPGAAFPRRAALITPEREPVGLGERVRVPLLRGTHSYAIELAGGPSLIRARVVQRRPRLKEFLQRRASPDHWIAAAQGALAGNDSAEGALLAVLLGNLRGDAPVEMSPPPSLPPLLRLVAEVELLRGRSVEPAHLKALLDRALPVLDDSPSDGSLPAGSPPGDALPAVGPPDSATPGVGPPDSATPGVGPPDSATPGVGPPDSATPGVDPALGWMLRRELARTAARAGAADAVVALASPALAADPASAAMPAPLIMAELASLRLEVDAAPEAFPWSLAAVHRAWTQAPLDPAVRAAYRRIWRWESAWSRLRPVTEPAAAEDRPQAHRYLIIDPVAPVPAGDGPVILEPRELWRAQGGQRYRVFAPPSRFDARRPVLLQAYVLMPPASRGIVALHVDDRVFHAAPLRPVEVLSVAVAPGAHELRLDGPPGTEAFLSLGPMDPPAGGLMRRARIRRIQPVASGRHPMRYILPEAHRGLPLRVELRAVIPPGRRNESLQVTMRTDAGMARAVVLDTRDVDPALVAIDGAPALSPLVQAVLWLPPAATQIWFETEPSAHILARVAVRERHVDAPAGEVGPGVVDPGAGARAEEIAEEHEIWEHGDPRWETTTDEIAALSRQLAASPDDPDLLLRRAHRLLDIGQGGHARADLARLEALDPQRLTPEQARTRIQLAERIDAWQDERYLPLQPGVLALPVAIAPGSLVLADGADDVRPWAEVAHTARRSGDRTPLYQAAKRGSSLLSRYYRADMLRRQGQHRQAALALHALYEDTGQPQIGIEALLAFEAALAHEAFLTAPGAGAPQHPGPPDDGAGASPGIASLTYGLALEIREQLVHPVVERVLLVTARQSRWEPIRNTDANAGFERLYLEQSEGEPGPILDVKQSLLAAPWPGGDAHVVDPGRGAMLDVDLTRPAVIRPQVWCRRIRTPAENGLPHCPVRWRVDGQPSRPIDVPLTRETTLGSVSLGKGRHRIAVSLAEGDPSLLLAVRFVASRPLHGGTGAAREVAVPVRRPGRLFVAEAERPVVITVLGPTTLRVESRRYDDDPPVSMDIEAVPAGAPEGTVRARTVVVDTARDEAASGDAGRQVRLSMPVRSTLVLPEPVAYRVTMRPRSGRVLVRFGRREDQIPSPSTSGEDAAPPLSPAATTAAADDRSWPAQPLALDEGEGRIWQPRRDPLWPTLSVGVQYRRDDPEERDIAAEALENRFQLDVAWRREIVADKAWVRVRPALRWHPGITLSYGLFADLDLRRLPFGLGIDLSGRLFGQSTMDIFAWAAQGELRVSRPVRMHPSAILVPSLTLRARHYSLDPTEAPAASIDPLVYNDFGRVHRYAIEPRLRAYWWVFQDQIAFATAQAMTNESLRTLDHIRMGIGWRGLIEWQRIREPLFQVTYEPNLRILDEHRSRSYLRHDIGVGLEWSLWQGNTGRLVIELRDDLYLSNLIGNRNVFLVGLRYDFTGERGLRDMLPSERRFNDLIEQGQWSD